jgi:ABC-type cobalt transport system substrate-binding protein
MPKILMAVVLVVAILLPTAAFADEGNWGDRDSASTSIVVQTEPIYLGTIAGDSDQPLVQFRGDQEHPDR